MIDGSHRTTALTLADCKITTIIYEKDEDIIEAQKVAESYQKVMTADFVMSLSRKVDDKVQNTGRFHVIKNRFGPDGLTYPAKINTNTGQIELYESDTPSGQEQQIKIS